MTSKELYENEWNVITFRPVSDKSAEIIIDVIKALNNPVFEVASDLPVYTLFTVFWQLIKLNHNDGQLVCFYKESEPS